MPLTLLGSTSGSVTIAAPAVAGSTTQTLVNVTGTLAPIVSGTVNAGGTNPFPSAGGPATVDFTGIPSWVKRITVMFNGLSTNGTSLIRVQLGDAGGIETSGYIGASSYSGTANTSGAASYSNGFDSFGDSNASVVRYGAFVFFNITGNTWALNGNYAVTTPSVYTMQFSGTKTLSDVLTQVRITTVNGTDLFDAGTINILYE